MPDGEAEASALVATARAVGKESSAVTDGAGGSIAAKLA